MTPLCETVFEFRYATPAAASQIAQNIQVEVGELTADRSTVAVDQTDCVVRVEIEAADLVALRAAINSWLRYIQTAEQVADSVSSHC